jgi:hypothetical protein
VIFGTLKAVADTMGINLTDEELARGCPDTDRGQDVWPKSSMRFLKMQKE